MGANITLCCGCLFRVRVRIILYFCVTIWYIGSIYYIYIYVLGSHFVKSIFSWKLDHFMKRKWLFHTLWSIKIFHEIMVTFLWSGYSNLDIVYSFYNIGVHFLYRNKTMTHVNFDYNHYLRVHIKLVVGTIISIFYTLYTITCRLSKILKCVDFISFGKCHNQNDLSAFW